MILLYLFREDMGWIKVLVKEVEKKDIIPFIDVYVDSIETYTGWWNVYQSAEGELIGYWEREEGL